MSMNGLMSGRESLLIEVLTGYLPQCRLLENGMMEGDMKNEHDDIRVGSAICKRTIDCKSWRSGWILPDGSFTPNPIKAQLAAEVENDSLKGIKREQPEAAKIFMRRKQMHRRANTETLKR